MTGPRHADSIRYLVPVQFATVTLIGSMAAGTLADVREDDDTAHAYIADLLTAANADARLGESIAQQSVETRKALHSTTPPLGLQIPTPTPSHSRVSHGLTDLAHLCSADRGLRTPCCRRRTEM